MKKYTPIIKIIGIIFIINVIGNYVYFRKDLTADQRYTLSKVSKRIASKFTDRVQVDVYLKGDFPLDFKRLGQATEQHLEELNSINSKINFKFINPTGIEEKLINKGLQPSSLTIEEEGSVSEKLIFPYAIVKYDRKEVLIPLLLNSSEGQEKQLQRSIENLEYAFSDAFHKLTSKKQKSIAVLRSNGTLNDIYMYDFLSSVKEKYSIAPFTLQPKGATPIQVLDELKKYDLLLIPKPTVAFSEQDKLVLDQYIMKGGKTLWLIDHAMAEMDSLQQTGEAMFLPRDLGLTDLLFAYGVRINFNLVQDLYGSKIAVATGNVGNQTQFKQFLWSYYPLVVPNQNHPITKNVEAVNLKFPSGIDTLKNDINKEILLQTSPLTKISGLPNIISLLSLANKVDPKQYQSLPQNLGVLLEGEFTSAYAHRTKPFNLEAQNKGIATKMIIISDGDIIANQIHEGKPTSLNVDKWTGQYFGNKDFLMNSVDYLLDDTGLLPLRGKTLDIKMLNKQKVAQDKGFWQLVNIALPLLLLVLFGTGYSWWRKRKYV
jgi:gliding-associated putative ABC transporter substrate-binding component GldG